MEVLNRNMNRVEIQKVRLPDDNRHEKGTMDNSFRTLFAANRYLEMGIRRYQLHSPNFSATPPPLQRITTPI
jgi:hypothetical protein